LNKGIMDKYRPEMKSSLTRRGSTYLDQLGIKYPTVKVGSQ
jgi:hypothetical protein